MIFVTVGEQLPFDRLIQTVDDIAILNSQDKSLVPLAQKLASKVVWFNDGERQENGDNPNFLAAAAVASVLNVDNSILKKVFSEFQGIEHRLEMVCDIDGIKFINDSKSTTTEASRWALEQIKDPIIWICGGRDKNLDFSVLKELVKVKVKKIIAIGEAAEKVNQSFGDVKAVECFDDFQSAIAKAFEDADAGDSVLLSPMCASFDMFKNFEQRGEEFKRIVNGL